MTMIMNHDITALMGQRIMQRNSLAMKRSLEKLSSGMRTKIADLDHTAELAIGETMRSRIYGMEKALYNTQDGISMIQTATGALDQTQSMLMRMRELSVQAANDVLTQQDRGYIQTEINEIRDAINRIGETTQFNRKKILSGDNAVLWSSTDSNMKAVVNGGLRSIDAYGQKYAVDGNYRITVNAEAGKAQVQKSDVFHVKHEDTIAGKSINTSAGVKAVEVSGDIPAGNYTLSLSDGTAEAPVITGSFGIDGLVSSTFDLNAADGLEVNASILFEVTGRNEANNTVTLRATAEILTQEGISRNAVKDNIIITEGGSDVNLSDLFGDNSLSIGLVDGMFDAVHDGAKFSVNVSAQNPGANAVGIDITGIMDSTNPDKWDGGPYDGNDLHYVLDGDATASKELNFRQFYVNERTGLTSTGNIQIKTEADFKSANVGGKLDTGEDITLAGFDVSYVGKIADGDTVLRDIDKFWDDNGMFILDSPKALTLTQGDGKQARIMLYADDTLNDLARKLNDAIADGLDQAKYINEGSFASYVESATPGMEGVEGTIVLRSVLTGKNGEITLSGNEDVLTALSLNTIQDSKETAYTVSVRDAHDGKSIAEGVKVTGNKMVGVIHKNIDVEFDPMMGITAVWNDDTHNFDLEDSAPNLGTEAILHLADNTTIFQTGAGEGEDVMIAIGDMRAHALGIDGVNVMSHDAAARSIGLIDSAIDKVSMQQAKLGSAQNRLEYHINNLTSEMESLVEANSTIRDVDYMTEILEFTKNKILMDSNTAMLAQTNQIQQTTILSLLR